MGLQGESGGLTPEARCLLALIDELADRGLVGLVRELSVGTASLSLGIPSQRANATDSGESRSSSGGGGRGYAAQAIEAHISQRRNRSLDK